MGHERPPGRFRIRPTMRRAAKRDMVDISTDEGFSVCNFIDERIARRWNAEREACKGIPTDALESGTVAGLVEAALKVCEIPEPGRIDLWTPLHYAARGLCDALAALEPDTDD